MRWWYELRLRSKTDSVRVSAVNALAKKSQKYATELLTRTLNSSNSELVLAAIRALTGRNGVEVTSALQDLLNHNELEVRVAAVTTLASMRDVAVAPTLVKLLSDQSPEVVRAAQKGLVGIGDAAADAVAAAFEVRDVQIWARAVKILTMFQWTPQSEEQAIAWQIGHGKFEEAAKAGAIGIRALSIALQAPSPRIRYAAVRALSSIDEPQASHVLSSRLGDAEAKVSRAAAQALARMKNDAAKQSLRQLITSNLSRVRDWPTGLLAANAIARTDSPEDFLRYIRTANIDSSILAAVAARNCKSTRVCQLFASALGSSSTDQTRQKASEALDSVGDDAIRILGTALNMERPDGEHPNKLRISPSQFASDRCVVAVELVRRFGSRAISPLRKALCANAVNVRQAAAKGLADLGWAPTENEEIAALAIAIGDWKKLLGLGEVASRPLTKSIDGDPKILQSLVNTDPELASGLVLEVVVGNSPDVVPALLKSITHYSMSFKPNDKQTLTGFVSEALSRFPAEHVGPLSEALNGADRGKALVAAQILGKFDLLEARDVLRKVAVESPLYSIREAAVRYASLGWPNLDPQEVVTYSLLKRSRGDAFFIKERGVEDLAFQMLKGLLKDGDGDMKRAACELMGYLSLPEVRDVLVELLDANDKSLRYFAALGLGAKSDQRSVGPLLELLKDGGYEARDLKERASKYLHNQGAGQKADSLYITYQTRRTGWIEDRECLDCKGRGCRSCSGSGIVRIPAWVTYNRVQDLYLCGKCGADASYYGGPPNHTVRDLAPRGILRCPQCSYTGAK